VIWRVTEFIGKSLIFSAPRPTHCSPRRIAPRTFDVKYCTSIQLFRSCPIPAEMPAHSVLTQQSR
jgi:hypothetical protein